MLRQRPSSLPRVAQHAAWVELGTAIAACFIGSAILLGWQMRGYDVGTHMFFADHYLRSWWITWEPRWYGGFDVVSYPPLFHQVLAIVSLPFGLENSAKLLSLLMLALFPVAVYNFARCFIGPEPARLTGACALLFPAFALTLVPFGQLPGIAGLELLLLACRPGQRYVRDGGALELGATLSLVAASAGAHHGTAVLFGPFLLAALTWEGFYDGAWRAIRWRRAPSATLTERGAIRRLAILVAASVGSVLAVIWPFWAWWLHRPIQTPIDHFSRHSLIAQARFRGLAFVIPYSLWAFSFLLVIGLAARHRRLLGLWLAAAVVFVLSLGGTTPLPRLLYGSQWAWLTYDRYVLWAGCLVLPLAAAEFYCLQRRFSVRARAAITLPVLLALVASTGYAAWYSYFNTFEPRQPAHLQPIATYLAGQDHRGYRYLTLGLGDRISRLSILTNVSSVDGNYSTARTDPALWTSGIDKLDSIKYWDPQAKLLIRYLSNANSWGLRWVFNNDPSYNRFLLKTGWFPSQTLSNGIVVWTQPTPPRRFVVSSPAGVTAESIWWGSVPLLALLLAVGLNARLWRPAHVPRQPVAIS